jgi:hypothetical protein
MPEQCCKDFFDKIPDDEPVFTIAARDELAAYTVADWIVRAEADGVNPDKIARARQHLQDIVEFQSSYPDRVKKPD